MHQFQQSPSSYLTCVAIFLISIGIQPKTMTTMWIINIGIFRKILLNIIVCILYHCMSRHLSINRCNCKWIWHRCYIIRQHGWMWHNYYRIMHHGWMSRRLPNLWWTYEWVIYRIKPLHIAWSTLTRKSNKLSYQCKVLWKVQGIVKSAAIYHQSPLWIEMENYNP